MALAPTSAIAAFMPSMGSCDVSETDSHVVFQVDAPGMTSADVHVRVTGRNLEISGERKTEASKDTKTFSIHERKIGSFRRAFHLPAMADTQGRILANLDHGILTVRVPKKETETKAIAEPSVVQVICGTDEGDGSLNKLFEEIPISVFPTPAKGKMVMLRSDTPILEAAKRLSSEKILSCPVIDVTQPETASWTDRYLGTVSMLGLTHYMIGKLGSVADDASADFAAEAEKVADLHSTTIEAASHNLGMVNFLALDSERSTLLDAMMLCGKYGAHRVFCVKSPGGDITNVLTQSALVQTLSANLGRFESVGKKTLKEMGLAEPSRVVSVKTTQSLWTAFDLIANNNVSGVPVLDENNKVVACISARDLRYIFSSTKIYRLLRMPIKSYLDVVKDGMAQSSITSNANTSLQDVIKAMVANRVHRVFVVNDSGNLLRNVSLCDVLIKFVRSDDRFHRFFGW